MYFLCITFSMYNFSIARQRWSCPFVVMSIFLNHLSYKGIHWVLLSDILFLTFPFCFLFFLFSCFWNKYGLLRDRFKALKWKKNISKSGAIKLKWTKNPKKLDLKKNDIAFLFLRNTHGILLPGSLWKKKFFLWISLFTVTTLFKPRFMYS